MQLSTASAISFETHQIHVRHGPASRRHTRAGDKAGAKTGLLDQPGAHPIAATRHHLNERPKRSANIRNAPRDPFGNTYPPLGLPQAIWRRSSRSSSRGVAYGDKQRRRASGVVPLIGYVDWFSARPGERVGGK